MRKLTTKADWAAHIAALKRDADTGNVSAMTDLGLNLLEGIQGRRGESIVRRNPRAAVAFFQRAALRGDVSAAASLGYAFDVGLGTKRDLRAAAQWYRRAVRGGDSMGASNLAIIYRDAGKPRLAFQWWMRGVGLHDGDAAVDVGSCYQYGLGTAKDAANAKRMFKRAIGSKDITGYGREEAMYHLAVQYIDEGHTAKAKPLLRRASEDPTFPRRSRYWLSSTSKSV